MNNSAFITTLPDFIEIQRASFCWFLSKGLSEELANFSVIEDLTNSITLNFFGNDFRIQKPLLDIVETKARDRTFAVRIYVPVLISKVKNFDNFNKDKIYTFIGEIPLMTDRGTFVVNGCERVIVNQIVRSPGIYYKRSFTTTRYNCSATLIPFRGGWLGFEIEHKYKKEETRPVCTVSFNKIQKVDLAKFLTLIGIKSSKIHSYFLHPEFFDCIETVEVVDQVGFNSQIFDSKYFNLDKSTSANIDSTLIPSCVTKQDLVIIIDGLINLFYGEGETDDIDHLKNRRVRSVGELLQTQFRSGLMRFERILSERMTFCDPNCIIISALVNPKPIMSMMREFFGSSQLSQFLDQTNPLAELTHKRRLSGLGPGGFNRDHVSLAVRDIHSSHYGRICPIETPEGKNAGLVSSLEIYRQKSSFGFIETPFFHVIDGYVRKDQEAIYLTAEEEENLKIAPGDIKLNNKGCIINSIVTVRYKTEFVNIPVQDVQYIAVSTIQIVSAATSLIPFLEHDDANRALMGSNMQRQAVPLLYPNRPIIGTGLESQLAAEGGSAVINYCDGIVVEANSQFILIKDFKQQKKVRYDLRKYVRSNQGTCIHQRPGLKVGDKVKAGDVLADGPSIDNGELALGQNIRIAFMPWKVIILKMLF